MKREKIVKNNQMLEKCREEKKKLEMRAYRTKNLPDQTSEPDKTATETGQTASENAKVTEKESTQQ